MLKKMKEKMVGKRHGGAGPYSWLETIIEMLKISKKKLVGVNSFPSSSYPLLEPLAQLAILNKIINY